jgi:S-adenosylmethionine:tRNA ribosyltransferase-isomerase
MIAAGEPVQFRPSARLLRADASGQLTHAYRWQLASFVQRGDVVVANDAATLPASLGAIHERTQESIEVRLAGRDSFEPQKIDRFVAVVFGAGNFRTRTEHRPLPPPLRVGDRLSIGPISAVIEAMLDHPRFVRLRFEASAAQIWRALAHHGRPIQYAHVHGQLSLWDVWTSIAALPVAYEAPSAAFALDWSTLAALRGRGATFVTLTHAAGISSTGDAELDRRLPLAEPYCIPVVTTAAIERARTENRRVIAIGTTVVRALEHATLADGSVRSGPGIADQRIGPSTPLRSVDAILSGTHETGTSHYELLRAFVTDDVLQQLTRALDTHGYLTHEFGDSVLIERDGRHAGAQRVRKVASSPAAIVAPVRKTIASACPIC